MGEDSETDEEDRLPGQGGQPAPRRAEGGAASSPGVAAGGGAHSHHHHGPGAAGGRMHQHSSAVAGGSTYVMEEVLRDMPQLPVIKYQHEKTKQFRNMSTNMDAKSQRAFLRDKKDVNRTLRYQCLVCAVNHDFKLNKCGG